MYYKSSWAKDTSRGKCFLIVNNAYINATHAHKSRYKDTECKSLQTNCIFAYICKKTKIKIKMWRAFCIQEPHNSGVTYDAYSERLLECISVIYLPNL